MPRSIRLYLVDMQMALNRIDGLLQGLDEAAFRSGSLAVDGVLFNLMTIGEAAKHIPPEVRAQAPAINWSAIGRFRDFVVHHYFSLDMDKVWEIVHTDLPPLKAAVAQLLQETGDEDNGKE